MSDITAQLPDALGFLFEPARYKVAHGGRGSAKSWSVARALLAKGATHPHRIVCLRELQKSISDSVHALLRTQVDALGLSGFYNVRESYIEGRNGTEFTFHGLRHNVSNIKSLEGATIAWVEEAANVSKSSWDVLIPTIRQPDSEIWITFNPELDTDETYRRFVVKPPSNAIVRHVSWRDNPWFPDVLRRELEDLKARDEDAYLHVWEGQCKQTIEGAIYSREIRDAMRDNRVTHVPYDRSKPVETFWDLGFADSTSIILAQWVGFELHIIDFIQDARRPLVDYLRMLRERGYMYGTDWLPHDARAKQLGSGKSIEELMREAGRTVRIVPQLSVADGINAVRTLFPNVWFDREKTTDLLQCLRRYRYDVNEDGRVSQRPLHDENSHAADSLRYAAVASKPAGRVSSAGSPFEYASEFA